MQQYIYVLETLKANKTDCKHLGVLQCKALDLIGRKKDKMDSVKNLISVTVVLNTFRAIEASVK